MPSDSETDDGPDAAALRETVKAQQAQLDEQQSQLEQLQETVQRLMPSRREVVAGAGLLGAGVLGGHAATDRASAQQAAGQVGTESSPEDAFLYDVDIANQLVSDVDAGGNDVTNVGALETGSVSTENIGLGDVTGHGLISQAVEHGKIWTDDGQLYDDFPTAANAMSNIMFLGPGEFDVSGGSTVSTPNSTILGCGRNTILDGGSGDQALGLAADQITVARLAATTNTGDTIVSLGGSNLSIGNTYVLASGRHGISLGSNNNRVIGCYIDSDNISNNDIRLTGDNNIVDDVIGTVSDNGTGNVVGEIT